MKNTLSFSHEAEACAAILFACLRANELGEFAENATFHTALRHRNVFKGHDTAALIAAAERHYEQLGNNPTALIDVAAAYIKPQARAPLFLQCVDVIFADGLVTPLEHRVIQFLTRKLEIDPKLAAKALEVLLAKNQL